MIPPVHIQTKVIGKERKQRKEIETENIISTIFAPKQSQKAKELRCEAANALILKPPSPDQNRVAYEVCQEVLKLMIANPPNQVRALAG